MAEYSEKQVANILLKAKSVIVISHYNPDPDAYGSSCAMALFLKSLKKKVICLNETELRTGLDFIPGTKKIVNKIPSNYLKYDLLVACDCGDIGRLGDSFKESLALHPNILNIDHHFSNSRFGKINIVKDKASSTCEVLYDILALTKKKISKEVANCLLSGIYGDTGSFHYSNTSQHVFQIASNLVKLGADPAFISSNMYERRSLSSVQLIGYALTNLKFHGPIAESVLTAQDFAQFKASSQDTEGLVEEIRSIDGVDISVMIRQDQNLWKVSMRSKKSKYDLSKVAAKFGGGGHKAAAAFRWRKSLEQLRSELITELKALV